MRKYCKDTLHKEDMNLSSLNFCALMLFIFQIPLVWNFSNHLLHWSQNKCFHLNQTDVWDLIASKNSFQSRCFMVYHFCNIMHMNMLSFKSIIKTDASFNALDCYDKNLFKYTSVISHINAFQIIKVTNKTNMFSLIPCKPNRITHNSLHRQILIQNCRHNTLYQAIWCFPIDSILWLLTFHREFRYKPWILH